MRLDAAGADGLVLFNRFLHPDVDPETLVVTPGVGLSTPEEARLARSWIAILNGHVRASLAATTGVEDARDVAAYLLAGADVVMTASALLRHGIGHAEVLLERAHRMAAAQGFRLRGRGAGPARGAYRRRPRRLPARRLRRRSRHRTANLRSAERDVDVARASAVQPGPALGSAVSGWRGNR